MDAKFALMSLIFGIGSTLVLAVVAFRHRDRTDVTMLSVTSMLLWVAIAFAQNVALTWLASLAYASFALAMALRFVMERLDGTRLSGHMGAVQGVASATFDVILMTGLLDLAVLVVLALVEKVIPYYVSLSELPPLV